jgi:hypothetical protein
VITPPSYVGKDGELKVLPKDIMQVWTNHFSDLGTDTSDVPRTLPDWELRLGNQPATLVPLQGMNDPFMFEYGPTTGL